MRETCRELILEAVKEIIAEKGKNEFKVDEVLKYFEKNRTEYSASTISTHIVSKCCKNAPHNHAKHYDDFERIKSGKYRLLGY
jgi:hypothetical protein